MKNISQIFQKMFHKRGKIKLAGKKHVFTTPITFGVVKKARVYNPDYFRGCKNVLFPAISFSSLFFLSTKFQQKSVVQKKKRKEFAYHDSHHKGQKHAIF